MAEVIVPPVSLTFNPSYHAPKASSWGSQGNKLALLLLALLAAWLFRQHIVGERVFIGNSDRLSSMLNVVQHHVDCLHSGRLDAWNENMFAGFNTFGLPFIFPQPLLFVEALFPDSWLFYVAGLAAWLLLSISGWSAFVCIRAMTQHTWASFVGACLYEFSALSTLRASQNEMSFSVLIVIPLMFWPLRRLKPGRELATFAFMALLLGFMLTCMFLQEAAYVMMLGVTYALFRSLRWRDWRPAVVFAMASVVACLWAMPRIVTVAEEVRQLERKSPAVELDGFDQVNRFQGMSRMEVWRIFDDDLCGQVSQTGVREYLNVTEGMLLFTSGFTCFVLMFGSLSLAGRFGRKVFFSDDNAFFATCALFGVAVVTLRPVQHMLFLLFMCMDFTHTRATIISLLPLCALVAIVLKHLLQWPERGTAYRTIVPALAAATLLLLAVRSTAYLDKLPEEPKFLETLGSCQYMRSVVLVLLAWCAVKLVDKFRGSRTGRESALGWTVLYVLAWLVPMGCLLLLQTADRHEWLRLISSKSLCLRVDILCQVEWTMFLTALLVFMINSWQNQGRLGFFLIQTLGCLLVADAVTRADERMNSTDNYGETVPFKGGHNLLAARGQFVRPGPEARRALQTRLEVPEFRSVLLADHVTFRVSESIFARSAFCAPHIAEFWGLRLLDGYMSGVPRGLSELPWPEDVVNLRALQFWKLDQFQEYKTWDLLALANVKYVVVVNQALYRNQVVENGAARYARADDVEVLINPLKPVPRHFFAASVTPSPHNREAIYEILTSHDIGTDVARRSFVNGIDGDRQFDASGPLQVSYQNDEIVAEFEPSSNARFLVLNELYHPRWRAYHGTTELPVYVTNGFMRGVEIPAGVECVTLRFQPFVKTMAAAALALGGVFVFVACGFVLHWSARNQVEEGMR